MSLICPICSEIFNPNDDIRMTPCGHAFHCACMLQWLQRSKTCPQCRSRCTKKKLIKFYQIVAETPHERTILQDKLCTAEASLRECRIKLKELEDKGTLYKTELKKMKEALTAQKNIVKLKDFALNAYEEELTVLWDIRDRAQKQQCEIINMKKTLQLLSTVEHVVSATIDEVEEMMHQYTNPHTLAVLVATFKRELVACKAEKQVMCERVKTMQKYLSDERSSRKALEDRLRQFNEIEGGRDDNFKIYDRSVKRKRGVFKILDMRPDHCQSNALTPPIAFPETFDQPAKPPGVMQVLDMTPHYCQSDSFISTFDPTM